jgi:hypothetical protein
LTGFVGSGFGLGSAGVAGDRLVRVASFSTVFFNRSAVVEPTLM